MELSPQESARIRALLAAERAALAGRVSTIHAHARDPLERDSEEQAAQLGNVEVVSAVEAEATAGIAAIDAALARLDEGTYGDCVTCGERIDAKRLTARPASAECFDCAEISSRRAR